MSVKIKRERPDQRRHHRVTAPMFVSVRGHRMRATDWSLGGLRVDSFPDEVPAVGDKLALAMTLPFQGFDVSFEATAEVVRNQKSDGMFAVKFLELGERERELMQHFIEELVRGAMVDVEDTIQRIDVPVTPASLKPDVNPVVAVPVRRWPTKTVMMTGFYAVLGLVIFGYAGLLVYSNFFRLEVQTAVITAPVEVVAAPADGRVNWGPLKPGDPVKAGQLVLSLIDNVLERDIELADIAIREQRAKLAFLKRRQADEMERVAGYAALEWKGVQQTRLELEALAAQMQAAESLHKRLQTLHRQGFTTDTILDNAMKGAVGARKAWESKKVELETQMELAEQNVGKRHYTGSSLVGDLQQIEAQVKLAEHEILITEQKLQAYVNQRTRQSVVAPFDGTLLELPRVDMGSVRKGETIAIIEQRRLRQVTAFLNQDEVLRIGLGDEALIYVPALGETLKARVAYIDRTTGFVQEQGHAQNPGYRWRGPVDRTAKVTLEFSEGRRITDQEKYRSGLPVVVVFPQRSTNSLLSSIRQRFSLSL